MDILEMEELLKNVDQRLSRVEQILPTLATKADLERFATKADLERFATKADLERFATKADLERFATKADLERFATKADLERFATKADLAEFAAWAEQRFATKAEVREEGERTRRYFDVVAERLSAQIRTIAEGHAYLVQRIDALRSELKADIAGLDARLLRVEAALSQRPS